MTAIAFTIPGRIGGKGRPRFARRGAHMVAYTDAKTVKGEALVRQLASLAMNGHPILEGPLALSVTVTVQPPPSWSKKKRAAATYLTGKPDCDNQIKLLADSMNNIVYHDDSQICDVRFSRRYDANASESVFVEILPLHGKVAAE